MTLDYAQIAVFEISRLWIVLRLRRGPGRQLPFPSIYKRVILHMGQPTLTVWGTGEQMRDFIHIENCVVGVLTMMDKIDDGDALNLSTGICTSFKKFARSADEECGYVSEVIGLSDKPSGVFARGGDIRRQLDFSFKHRMSFREGIRMALSHYDQDAQGQE